MSDPVTLSDPVADVVVEPFYFQGAIREVGASVTVENPADRRMLLDRGIIGDGKALPDAPVNKSLDGAPNNKGKPPATKA